jgi:hypothetical protein
VKGLIFKEQSAQNIQNTILSAPGMARAGGFCDAGSGVAPSFNYIGGVKGFCAFVVVVSGFFPLSGRTVTLVQADSLLSVLVNCIGDLLPT